MYGRKVTKMNCQVDRIVSVFSTLTINPLSASAINITISHHGTIYDNRFRGGKDHSSSSEEKRPG